MIKIIGLIISVLTIITLFGGPKIYAKIKGLDELPTEQVLKIKMIAFVEALIAVVLVVLIK